MYKNLNMQQHITSGGKVQFNGDQRTFVIAGVGVFQRMSSRQRKTHEKRIVGPRMQNGRITDEYITLLYKFKPSAPLRAQLHFVEHARATVQQRFQVIWREEFVREMSGRARK